MELVKSSRPPELAAIFGHSLCTKRTAKIGFGLIAAVFLLQFYYVRELVFMEAVLALGFVVVALIGSICPRLHRGFMVAKAWFWAQGSWCPRLRKTPAALYENDGHRSL